MKLMIAADMSRSSAPRAGPGRLLRKDVSFTGKLAVYAGGDQPFSKFILQIRSADLLLKCLPKAGSLSTVIGNHSDYLLISLGFLHSAFTCSNQVLLRTL